MILLSRASWRNVCNSLSGCLLYMPLFARPSAMQAGAVLTIERTDYSTVANLEVFDFSGRGGQITSRPPGCL